MIYNDRALENDGNWTLEEDGRFIREFQSPLAGTAREAALALHGLSQARSWLLSHREQLPLLIFKRLLSLWWPHSRPDQRIVIVLAFAGLLILGMPDALACACLALIISHSLAIALTSNDPNGRLLYAVQPALLCLAAVAIGDVSTRLSQALIARR